MKKIIISLVAVFGMVGLFSLVALAKSDKAEAQSNSSDKKIQGQAVEDEVADPLSVDENGKAIKTKTQNAGEEQNLMNSIQTGDLDDADDGNSEKQSKKIKDSVEKVAKNLKDIAEKETGIGAKLGNLVVAREKIQNGIIDSVEKIETKSNIKTFLIGTDYKNLGQLRSSMVQNRNQIQELTKMIAQVEDDENRLALQSQLQIMVGEREEIESLIKEEEGSFSLFGWAFKMMNGYSEEAVDTEAEVELEAEVQEALNIVADPIVEEIVE